MPDTEKLVEAYRTIINELDDVSRPGVLDTPMRAAKAMASAVICAVLASRTTTPRS